MNEWRSVRIGDVAEIFDGPHATPKTVDAGPIFLGIGSLQNGRINLGATRHVTPEDFETWTRRVRPLPGDVVFSYETRLGEAAIIPEGLICCLGRRMGLIRANRKRLDPRFFLYLYLSPEYQTFLRSKTISGATVDRLALKEFPSFPIPLPSILEQKAIASILGALDEKIELNRRMNETLEAMARAIYGERSAKWGTETTLGELADIYDGPHATPTKTTHGPVFLGISNLANGYIDFADLAHLSEEDYAKWTRRVVPLPGDIVFSYETRLGECARIPEGLRCCLGRRMGLLRPKKGCVHSELLLFAFLSADFQETIRCRTVHGSTVDRILLTELGRFPVTMPSFEEQSELAEALSPLRQRAEHNQHESQTLAALRDLLLPKLMSGEIRVKDAGKMVGEAA